MPSKLTYLEWLNSRRNHHNNCINNAANRIAVINHTQQLKAIIIEICTVMDGMAAGLYSPHSNAILHALYKQETKDT